MSIDRPRPADPIAARPVGAVILASASPRRREILTRAGIRHRVVPADVDESARAGEAPDVMATRLALEKAVAVESRLAADDRRFACLVLAADTIVVIDDEVLGKPADPDHAIAMLRRLTGRRHRVITGVAVVHADTRRHWQIAVASEVDMRAASDDEIRAYVATGEPLDKAGSYGIQGEGGRRFVTGVLGSESNVMGLPLDESLALLARAEASTRADAAPDRDPPLR